ALRATSFPAHPVRLAVKLASALTLSAADVHPPCANLPAPPLRFTRRPPQSKYPPGPVHLPDPGAGVRHNTMEKWYFTAVSTPPARGASLTPTYATYPPPRLKAKV